MTPIAPHITNFLHQRLLVERKASANTCESYAYAFQLLFQYVSDTLKIAPSAIQFEHLQAPVILNFLSHLEVRRRNTASSRNIRLAAIKAFMRFMEYRAPGALQQIRQVLAISLKKTPSRLVAHLTGQEMKGLLDAPNPTTRSGTRDRAMLYLCFAGGLRVSELIGVQLNDISLQPQPSLLVHGKGRRERRLPLWKETVATVRAWLAVRGATMTPELFVNARGQAMTRAGFEYILKKHVAVAGRRCPSILNKKVSPHCLRHTCALTVLQATQDIRKVSLWLGHASVQTTEIYTRTDQSVKLEVLESVVPPKLRSGHFKATDKLIAALKSRPIMQTTNRSSP